MSSTLTTSHHMTIDGARVMSGSTFDVVNPATGEAFAEAPDCTRDQLDDAMHSAAATFASWRRDESSRRQLLLTCAEALIRHAEELAELLTREQGKPLPKAAGEIIGAAKWFTYTAGLEIPIDVALDNDRVRVEVRRRPHGVVAAITPWNYPVSLAVWKIAPALLAGNTVVLKPSPYTPLTTLRMGAILRDVLPTGVLNVISGGDELGVWMTTHPKVRKISFTGSVATGKLVAAAAAPDLKRVTLELGGNDPAILLPDVDVSRVAKRLFWGAFENCGQVCSAIKRVYVPHSLYGQLLSELGEVARGVRVGDGFVADTQLGPLNNRPQFERVQELVEDAKQTGAKVVAGGHRLTDDGYFYAPTIVGDVSDGVRVVDEEQFGPVLPVVSYVDLEDAIARANATHFGLSGSVWSSDTTRAKEVATQLECGTAWVNQHLNVVPHAPFGGAKWSGLGVENGPWGLLGFTEFQTINVAKG
ncbi:MAG: aldehyde dehydrogenase family protein [Acidobacteriota bacterium]|nr:aldehyde dehydrogenase family protein [Acidobacteriota bacterium]